MKYTTIAKDIKNPLASVDQAKPGQHVITDAKGKVLKVVTVTGRGKTDQSFKDMLSIEHMLAGAKAKGLLRTVIKYEGEYDDYPNFDYQEAQFMISRARNMFEALPSAIRNRFENKPELFMKFVNDKANRDELIEMGVIKLIDGKKADGTPVDPPPPADPLPPADPPAA